MLNPDAATSRRLSLHGKLINAPMNGTLATVFSTKFPISFQVASTSDRQKVHSGIEISFAAVISKASFTRPNAVQVSNTSAVGR